MKIRLDNPFLLAALGFAATAATLAAARADAQVVRSAANCSTASTTTSNLPDTWLRQRATGGEEGWVDWP